MVPGPPDARIKLVIDPANAGGRHTTSSDYDRALARNSRFGPPRGRCRVYCNDVEGSKVTCVASYSQIAGAALNIALRLQVTSTPLDYLFRLFNGRQAEA